MDVLKSFLTGFVFLGLLPLCLILFNKYGKLLLNFEVGIKRINPVRINKLGDLSVQGNGFFVKFLWTKRLLKIGDIKKISGFSDDDFSNDFPNDWIVLNFGKRASIIFNAQKTEHKMIIDDIAEMVGIESIDWERDFWHGTEDRPKIFYSK